MMVDFFILKKLFGIDKLFTIFSIFIKQGIIFSR